jgi:hypothetical protein
VHDSWRVTRLKAVAEAMAVPPGRRLPQRCRSPYAVPATDPLCPHAAGPPEHLLAGPRALGRDARRQPGGSRCLEDTPALAWSGRPVMAGLGPLGPSAVGLQGCWMLTVLSVRWPDTPQDNPTRQPVAGSG